VKILIIRFSSIGDIVLTTPVIRCTRQQLGAEVHFLTKKSFAAVVQSNPYLDKIFYIEKNVSEVKNDLQSEKYDYVIDLHNNLRSWQVRRFLQAKTLRFDKINFPKWLICNLKINILPKIHIVDRYLDTVKTLGVKNDGQGLDYFIPTKDNVDFFIHEKKQAYIAFVIGAAHATKRLPTEKIIAICKTISHPIVLLGGKDEAATGALIATEAGKHVINTCGQYNLNQSASLVKNAACVISHDTGLMHIAAAFQQKIIAIWGNTIPEFGMYPYFSKGENKCISVEVKGLSCRPCSKIGHDTCPKKHFRCMNDLNIEEIKQAVEKFQSL
jgi:ADP-heptose:LPS heptosyltransferase